MGIDLMEWAVAIGAAVGGALSAAVMVLQVYHRIVAPALKKIAPAVKELTGGDDAAVPGLRSLVETNGAYAQQASRAATAALDGQNLLRRDFSGMKGELTSRLDASETSVAEQFGRVHGRLDEQGRELGELKTQSKATVERLTVLETIASVARRDGGGAGDQHGRDHRESPHAPPQPGILPGGEP